MLLNWKMGILVEEGQKERKPQHKPIKISVPKEHLEDYARELGIRTPLIGLGRRIGFFNYSGKPLTWREVRIKTPEYIEEKIRSEHDSATLEIFTIIHMLERGISISDTEGIRFEEKEGNYKPTYYLHNSTRNIWQELSGFG